MLSNISLFYIHLWHSCYCHTGNIVDYIKCFKLEKNVWQSLNLRIMLLYSYHFIRNLMRYKLLDNLIDFPSRMTLAVCITRLQCTSQGNWTRCTDVKSNLFYYNIHTSIPFSLQQVYATTVLNLSVTIMDNITFIPVQ